MKSISVELTRAEWREVVEALQGHSSTRYMDSQNTNNSRHSRAWLLESDSLEQLDKKVRKIVGIS